MNRVYLIGRLKRRTLVYNGCLVTLAVKRLFKNEEGIYETDDIDCIISENLAERMYTYCQDNDLVSVNGMLRNNDGNIIVAAEKIAFMSSKAGEQE